MGRSNETFSKKEKEKKKIQKQKEKLAKKETRKANPSVGGGLEAMMAYVDENGMITDTPPDPSKKRKINASSIEIGIPKREDIEVDPMHQGKVAFLMKTKVMVLLKIWCLKKVILCISIIQLNQLLKMIKCHLNLSLDQKV